MHIEKKQLISEVEIFLDELKKKNPGRESLEWYLINNLNNYLISLTAAETAKEIKLATAKFDMFCIDCMNWDTPLFKRCANISDIGFKIAMKNS